MTAILKGTNQGILGPWVGSWKARGFRGQGSPDLDQRGG